MDLSKTKVAFIGLGAMGFPMAGHLCQAGLDVIVYNRTLARAKSWQERYNGGVALSLGNAVKNRDIVLTCVGADRDVEQVALGQDGFLAHMPKGAMWVDHTTASADLARAMAAQASQQGVSFADAPLTGGQAGAEAGTLAIMVGASKDVFARLRPVLEVYAKTIIHIGLVGCGQQTKMVNQVCAAGVIQGLAEGLALAKASGLDTDKVIEIISQGASASWMIDHRAKTMVDGHYDFGFAVDWIRKDLQIALSEASKDQLDLPLTHMVEGFYAQLQAAGYGRDDSSSLYKRYSDGLAAKRCASGNRS